MKTNAIIRIVIYSLVVILLMGILVIGIAADTLSFRGFHETNNAVSGGNVTASGVVDAGEVRKLKIEWAAGSISIQPGDVENITFAETEAEEKDRMVWKQTGEKLVIQFCESSIGFGFTSHQSKDLVITVPKAWTCEELELDSAATEVKIQDLTIDSVDFDGASGECTFENCQINSMDLDSASCEIDFSGTLNELDCDGASVSVTAVLYNEPNRMDLDMASGEMRLTIPEGTGFRVSMDGLSSDFTSDFETTRTDGDYLHGDGSCRINVSGLSSSLAIYKAE